MIIGMLNQITNNNPTHVAYADETSYNIGRYRGVALVTMSLQTAKQTTHDFAEVLNKSGINELKWSYLKSARNRFATIEMIDLIINLIVDNEVRIDAITWDIEDTRHKIRRRSDIRNLRRMYYFLFKNALVWRWPKSCIWQLYPDETSFGAAFHLRYLTMGSDLNDDLSWLNISGISEVKSHQEPLVQVADFFAGIAAYSRNSYQIIQKNLQNTEVTEVLSKSDKERGTVINYLYAQCKNNKLGVSLQSSKGFRTRNPKYPLNFWWYEPQGEYDKAPLRY